jgi:TctA family transporter
MSNALFRRRVSCLNYKYLLQFCSTYVPVIAYVLTGVVGVCYVFSSIVGFRVLCVEKPHLQ